MFVEGVGNMEYPVIIALDFPSGAEVFHFLRKFPDEPLFVKVGMELFYRRGRLLFSK